MTGIDGNELAQHLSDLARALQEPQNLQQTLDAIVGAAAGTVPGAEHASISTVSGRREVRTVASTNDLPRVVDQAQYDTGQGPCLDTLYERKTVQVPNMASEQRWPQFAKRAAELGAGSMLSVQLFVKGDDLGALNLLNERPGAFGEESEQLALLFATHASIAMAGAQEQAELRAGMDTRDIIGQAKGVLMERYQIHPDEAFTLLVQSSQKTNRKLRDVAQHLTATGKLPGT